MSSRSHRRGRLARRSAWNHIISGLAVPAALAVSTIAFAQDTANWTDGGSDGLYSNPLNWDLGGGAIPINGGTTYLVVIPGGEIVAFDVAGSSAIDGLDLGINGELSIGSGRSLDVLGEAAIGGSIVASGSGTSFSADGSTTALVGTRFNATGGAEISSSATSWEYASSATNAAEIFSADGAGSLVDVSSLLTYDDDRNLIGSPRRSISAGNGGTVDLSSLLSIVGGVSNDTLAIELKSGGTISLGALESTSGVHRFEVASGETLSMPSLTTVDRSRYSIEAGGTLSAPALTDWTAALLEFSPDYTVTTAPLTNVNGSLIHVFGGMTYDNVAATEYSYAGTGTGITAGDIDVLLADGAGTLLDLSSLVTYEDDRNLTGSPTRTIRATNGGTIDMSNVTTMVGGVSNDLLDLDFNNSGTLLLGNLASTTRRLQLSLEDGKTKTLASLASMDQGMLNIGVGSTLNLPVLTEFTSGLLELDPSVGLNTPSLTNIDGTRVAISGGLDYTDVIATTYEYAGNSLEESGPIFSADGAGSRLDLSTVVDYEDDRNLIGAPTRTITATNGGEVDFSSLQTLTGGVSNDILSIDFTADGEIKLDALTTTDHRVRLFAGPGTNVSIPTLTSMDEGILEIDPTASLDLSGLSSFTSGILALDPTVNLTTAPLVNVDGTRMSISGGLNYDDVVATTYEYVGVGLPDNASILAADGAGSVLDLSTVVTYIDDRNLIGSATRTISATNGGTVDLSNVTTIEGGVSNDILALEFTPDGTILLDALTGTTHRLRFNVASGAAISIPTLTSTDEAIFEVEAGGSLDLSSLTSVTSSTLALDPTVALTTGLIDSIDGSRFTVTGGLNYADVVATKYDYTGTNLASSGEIFVAEGAGSVLDLSTLKLLEDDRDLTTAATRTIAARDEGVIDLSNVRRLIGGRNNDTLELRAETGGRILLDNLGGVARSMGLEKMVDIVSDGTDSAIEVSNLELTTDQTIQLLNEGELRVDEGFTFAHTSESEIDLEAGRIAFDNGDYPGRTVFEIGGADNGVGGSTSGNFGVGQIVVGTATDVVTLNLVDWYDNGNRGGGAESLYLFGLAGEDGLRVLNGSTVIIPEDANVYAVVDGASTHLNALFPVDVTTIAFDEGFLELGDVTTDVETAETVSLQFSASPNPMRLTTSLQYGLSEAGEVSLQLYDVQGRLVRSLVDRVVQSAGNHSAEWDGDDDRGSAVASGVYFAHLKTAEQTSVKRITLLP